MSRKPLHEGDPVAPVYTPVTTGMHERTLLICAFAANSAAFAVGNDGWLHSAEAINTRIIELADDMLARKEGA